MRKIEVVRIPVDPTNAAALEAVIRERRSDYFAPPHCLALDFGQSGDSTEVIAVVTWASKEAHATAGRDPGAAALFAAVGKLAAGAPWIASVPASSPGPGR
jgi:quinol monooxygenase YgiN